MGSDAPISGGDGQAATDERPPSDVSAASSASSSQKQEGAFAEQPKSGNDKSRARTGMGAGPGAGPKGLARIKAVRKIIDSIIKRSRLEVTELHIFQPDDNGVCAKGKIRLSHLGTGPLPLVGLQIKFKEQDGVALHWHADESRQGVSSGSGGAPESAYMRAHIDPITLQQGSPGSATSEVGLRLYLDDTKRAAFVKFVQRMLQADPQDGVRVQLLARGVQVKTYGLRFGGLLLDKDVVLGGLGSLDGALIFGSEPENGKAKQAEDKGRTSRLKITDLDITGGDEGKGIQISSSVTIVNPASKPKLVVEPGPLRFALCVQSRDAVDTKDGPKDLPAGYVQIGNITLEARALHPGPNKIQATGFLKLPSAQLEETTPAGQLSSSQHALAAGKKFIARILQNERVKAYAIATRLSASEPGSGASDIGWLAAAFEGTRINVQIPPLGDRVRLLDGAEVRVEDRDDRDASNANSPAQIYSTVDGSVDLQSAVARASLRNSFGTDIVVQDLSVRACSAPLVADDGKKEILELGTLLSPKDQGAGLVLRRGEATHVSLPMQINPDPKVLIELLRKSAVTENVNLGNPFTELLEDLRASHWTEAGFERPPRSRPASSYSGTSRAASSEYERHSTSARRSVEKLKEQSTNQRQEPANDLAGMLAAALAHLRITAHIKAYISIGSYYLPGALQFEQRDLPIALSTVTAAALLPLVGKPFVKALVDRAEVELCAVEIKHMHEQGIDADIALRLTNFGPLSAQVDFTNGLKLHEIAPQDKGKDDPPTGPVLAIIHFLEPLAVIAGDDDAVMIGAQIVPPDGAESLTRFGQFLSNVLKNEETTYHSVAESISVTSGGVHFESTFAKNITVDGLAGLPDLRLDDLKIVGDADAPAGDVSFSVAAPAHVGNPTAIEITAILRITNRGNLHLQLQKLEVGLSFEGAKIGQASIDNVDLQPYRTSSMKIKGILYASHEQGPESYNVAIQKISRVIEKLFRGEEVVIDVQGRRGWVRPESIEPHQSDRLRSPGKSRRNSAVSVSLVWLDDALRSFATTAVVQWKDGIKLVTGVEVGHIQATFAARKPMQLKIDSVTASYRVPFPISFDIASVGADIDVFYKDSKIATCQAAQDSIEHLEQPLAVKPRRKSSVASSTFTSGTRPSSPMRPKYGSAGSESQGSSGKIKLSLKSFDLLMQDDSDDLFGDMIANVFETGPEGKTQLTLRGSAQVKAKSALGMLDINVPLGVEHQLELQGLDGLRHSPLKYDSLEITGATSSYISLTLNAYSHNPSSSLTVHVPDSSVSLAAYYKEAFVGDVVIGANAQGVTLAPGAIALPDCAFRYHTTPSSEAQGHLMLSDLFEGRSADLSIRGHKRSSVNAALAKALTVFDLPITIEPLGLGTILERIKVTLGLNVVTSNSIDARYTLDNPTKLDIDVLRLEVNAFYQSKPFGTAVRTFSKEGKEIPITMRSGLGASDASTTQSPDNKTPPTADGQKARKSSQKDGRSSGMERLRIPAGAKGFEGAIVVKLQQPLDQLVLAFLHERGSISLDVELVAKLDINGYNLPRFVYRQKNVPLDVAGLQGVARLLRLV